jgi:hypothetical protein
VRVHRHGTYGVPQPLQKTLGSFVVVGMVAAAAATVAMGKGN